MVVIQHAAGSEDERPVHTVCVDRFFMGKYEITQGQWKNVMGDNPSRFKKGDDYPVEYIRWDEVQEFISKLNAMTGEEYRLPSEAEWEFAARAGGRKLKYAADKDKINPFYLLWFFPLGFSSPN